MSTKHWVLGLLIGCSAPLLAQETIIISTTAAATEAPETDQTTSAEESEAKDIIPRVGETTSSETLTPTSLYVEKKPYDQAREELIRAHELLDAGHFEAASDTALEAYDDLVELRRVPGVKRSQIRSLIHQAATIYVEAGIAYIKKYVQQHGNTPTAREEGRSRLEDLRDVARGYNELNRMLNTAISQLSGAPVSPTKKKKSNHF